uniref:Negative elongation factor complex member A n=1 Tax=Eptatretus burgeri TaxID=7764 RepID=A0A8C4R236_EPTBU
MASVRESDTSLWLHNKLGSPDELWTPAGVVSLLSKDVVQNIEGCFRSLSSPVKLKLLLGVLHLPRRTVDEIKTALNVILTLAQNDSDSWVQMIASIIKTYPESGSLNLELEDQSPNAQNVLIDLKEKVSDCDSSTMLPLECQYLNKSALTTLVGPLAPPIKHFQLRRKPKSAALRAELLQKCESCLFRVTIYFAAFHFCHVSCALCFGAFEVYSMLSSLTMNDTSKSVKVGSPPNQVEPTSSFSHHPTSCHNCCPTSIHFNFVTLSLIGL